MKIALINIAQDMESPPIGLLYLATYLHKKIPQARIKIIDINFEDIVESTIKFNPDFIGISAFTVKYNIARNYAKKIKEFLKVPIIIGGVHISSAPQSFDKEAFDVGVMGEGELTFEELAKLFLENKSFPKKELKNINGLVFYDNKLIITQPRELINLEMVPVPDRTLLHLGYFKPKISQHKIYSDEKVIETGMLTSRGCPFKCTFCSTTMFWRKVRYHSVEHVIKELKDLHQNYGVNYIIIFDDMFTANKKRLEQIYEAMVNQNLIGKIKFSLSLRVNVVNEEILKLLKKINVITINFGFESGSNRVLTYLKGESVNINMSKNAIKLAKKYNFNVCGSLMMGSPGETKEDMIKTLKFMDFMILNGVNECWCGVTQPLPQTALWDYALKNKILNIDFNQWETLDPSYVHTPRLLDKSVSKNEFYRLFKAAKHKSFYLTNGKKPGLKRKLLDQIYYNENIYKHVLKIFRIMPKQIKRPLINLLGLRGEVSLN